MSTHQFTDPTEILLEGPIGWAREKLTGVKEPDVVSNTKDISTAKDVTPDPFKGAVNTLVSAYNNSDVAVQVRFIELLIKYDGGKVQELLTKHKGN